MQKTNYIQCPKCYEGSLEEADHVGNEQRFLWCANCEYTQDIEQ